MNSGSTVHRQAWRGLGLLVLCLTTGVAEQRPAHGQRATGLVAHEWGVWRIDARGRVTLEDLEAESPPFVTRVRQRPATIPRIRMGPTTVEKPVLFLYADRPTPVRIDVQFVGGTPWLHAPAARHRGERLSWRGRVVPAGAPGVEVLPEVAPGHWWNHLRAVGASTFRGRTNERFVFYDGLVQLERGFEMRGPAHAPSLRALGTETEVWVVDRSGYTEYEVRGDVPRLQGRGNAAAFRVRLDRALQARGLSAAESGSLLQTWAPELLQVTDADPFPHAVYFVPRDAYDRMLPLRIRPTPAELVRVGLVIEHLQTR